MTIKLAGKNRKTSRPTDLDKQLIAATGCGEKEIELLLSAGPDRAARALRPFLEDGVLPGPELPRAIAADPTAIDAIRQLYAAPVDDAAPASGETE